MSTPTLKSNAVTLRVIREEITKLEEKPELSDDDRNTHSRLQAAELAAVKERKTMTDED